MKTNMRFFLPAILVSVLYNLPVSAQALPKIIHIESLTFNQDMTTNTGQVISRTDNYPNLMFIRPGNSREYVVTVNLYGCVGSQLGINFSTTGATRSINCRGRSVGRIKTDGGRYTGQTQGQYQFDGQRISFNGIVSGNGVVRHAAQNGSQAFDSAEQSEATVTATIVLNGGQCSIESLDYTWRKTTSLDGVPAKFVGVNRPGPQTTCKVTR